MSRQRLLEKRVYWHTHETNLTAMKLYDKLATHTGLSFIASKFDILERAE
jgi:hypothetical protein